MADDLGERSEEATPKRRQEARAEGQVAKSQDLSAVLLLTVGTATVAVAAAWMLDQPACTLREADRDADRTTGWGDRGAVGWRAARLRGVG